MKQLLSWVTIGLLLGSLRVSRADDLAAETYVKLFASGEKVFSNTSPSTATPGARLITQAGFGSWFVALRGTASGLPGQFEATNPTTFKSIEGVVALGKNLGHIKTGSALWAPHIGTLIVAGKSIAYDNTTGKPISTASAYTLGACGKISGPGFFVLGCGGKHEALPGAAVFGSVHFPISTHLWFAADGGVGSRSAAFGRVAMLVPLN